MTHCTEPIQVTIDDKHSEIMQFHLFNSAQHPLILGFPCLKKHNPHINWHSGKITGWGEECKHSCKLHQVTRTDIPETLVTKLGLGNDSDYPDLSEIPSCYYDLKEVMNKTKAMSLPPHRPFDCAIDLLPGAPIPKWRLSSISGPKRAAMTEYITSSLKAGIIRPSSSPAGAGFFFVGKKDGSLRPCIDYSPLNGITIKNCYPLPLISSAFELLQTATVFTKLDIRNAYHLIRIRDQVEDRI